ncbi:MAG: amino acid permease [Alphaproteobacteria bacterium]
MKKYGLNLISVTALGIGSVVGAGIFALLGQVISDGRRPDLLRFYHRRGCRFVFGVFLFPAGRRISRSGGLTDYFHIAFKKRWVVGTFSLIYMMTSAVSICMMAKSFGIYAVKLFPHVQDTNFFINAAACFLIVGLAALNMQRSKDVGNTEIVMVSIKMGILLSLIIAALIHYDIAEKMQTIPFNEVKFMEASA